MKVELEIIELDSVKKALDRDSYEKDGIYIVNDGIGFLLVVVQADFFNSIALPNKEILGAYKSEKYAKAQRDLFGIIDSRLDFIVNKLKENKYSESNLSEVVEIIKAINEPFIGKK